MKKISFRISLVAALALVAAACTPTGPAPGVWEVRGQSIEVVRQNSSNAGDRPYVIQLGFRSKLGVADSSSAQLKSQCYAQALPAPDAAPAGTTIAVPTDTSDITFPDTQNLDVGDVLLQTAPLEIFGTLTFVMNRNVLPFITSCAVSDALRSGLVPVLEDALDLLIAASPVPPTQEQLVDLIVSNLGNFLSAVGSLIGVIIEGLGNPDAVVGVGVQLLLPTAGTLTSLLNGAFELGSIFNPDLKGGFIPLEGLPSSVKIRVGPLSSSTAVFDLDGDNGHYVYTSRIARP
jgi:hypothetical protein